MRLPEDVAIEVAIMVKRISKNSYTEKSNAAQDIAHKLVNTNLLADKLAWYKYMAGV